MSAADSGRLPLLLFVGPALVVLAFLFSPRGAGREAEARRRPGRGASFSGLPPLAWPLSALAVVAGTIHAAVAPEHLEEAVPFGVFFALVAALQLAFAFRALRQPSPATWAVGLMVNLAVVAVWSVSRTAGLPFGPEAGQAEPTGLLDTLCTAAELLLAAGCFRLLRETSPRVMRA
jgi:hypothetical protein